MKDNLSIVITIMVVVLLMVLFPLYNFFERQDDMSYNLVLKATTNFADQIMNNGYIDQDMYNNFVSELGNTGNIYDIQIEAHRKVLTKNNGEDKYTEQSYIDYNDDIFDTISKGALMAKTLKNNIYSLNAKDEIYVRVKNSNTTLAGSLFNSIIPTSSKTRIDVSYGGLIKNNSWAKVDATYTGHYQAPSAPLVYLKVEGKDVEQIEDGATYSISDIKNAEIEGISTAFQYDNSTPNEIRKLFFKFKTSDNTHDSTYEPSNGNGINNKEYFKLGNSIEYFNNKPLTIECYAVDELGYKSETTKIKITTVETSNNETLNNNNKFEPKSDDIEKIDNYLNGTLQLTNEQIKNYDVDNNKKVTKEDKEFLQQYIDKGYILGDVNQDLKITEEDHNMVENYVNNKLTSLTDIQKKAADLTNDGVIKINDATEILKIINDAKKL